MKKGGHTNMRLEIDDEIIQKTKKCPHTFACLSEEKFPLCSVKRPVNGGSVFVITADYNQCPYKMSFGYSYICYCPVRYTIYHSYNR